MKENTDEPQMVIHTVVNIKGYCTKRNVSRMEKMGNFHGLAAMGRC